MDGLAPGKGLWASNEITKYISLGEIRLLCVGQDTIQPTGLCYFLGQQCEDGEGGAIRDLEDVPKRQEVPTEKYQSSGTLIPPSKTLIS